MALSDEKEDVQKKRRVYKRRGGCTKKKEGVQKLSGESTGTGSIKSI